MWSSSLSSGSAADVAFFRKGVAIGNRSREGAAARSDCGQRQQAKVLIKFKRIPYMSHTGLRAP